MTNKLFKNQLSDLDFFFYDGSANLPANLAPPTHNFLNKGATTILILYNYFTTNKRQIIYIKN